MKHYVILLEEKRFAKETYYSQHFLKKEEGNIIPNVPILQCSIIKAIDTLERNNFKNLNGQSRTVIKSDGQKEIMPFPQTFLTLEEIAINDFSNISIYRFDIEGNFKDSILFERVVSK